MLGVRGDPAAAGCEPEERAATDSLRRKLALQGSRKSYLQNCESMQRVHIVPGLRDAPVQSIRRRDVEALAEAMLADGKSPKTVRNYVSNVFGKLQVADRAQAVVRARRAGFGARES